MTKIGDMATIRIHGKVPEDPQDDYVAAAKAVWRLLLAKAAHADPRSTWHEQYVGRDGVMMEAILNSVIRELWPTIPTANLNAVYQGIRYSIKRNMAVRIPGHGNVKSIIWVASEWDPSGDAPRAGIKQTAKASPAHRVAGKHTTQKPVETVRESERVVEVEVKATAVAEPQTSAVEAPVAAPAGFDFSGFTQYVMRLENVAKRHQEFMARLAELVKEYGN